MKRADILPPSDSGITARDRVAIIKFFKEALNISLDNENEALADAVFTNFRVQASRLRDLEQRYSRLPNRPDLPENLDKLGKALEKCLKSRQVQPTLQEVKRNLDVLRDGVQQLGILLTDLDDTAVTAVRRAIEIRDNEVAQLREIDRLAEVSEAVTALEEQLNLDRPWGDIKSLEPHLQALQTHYKAVRLSLLESQEQQAETIRNQVKQRKGFFKLSEDKAVAVLYPIQEATYDTTADAKYPALLKLKDSTVLRLKTAAEKANADLDTALSQVTDEQIMPLPLNLNGQEIRTVEEVRTLVKQLEERLMAQLEGKTNVCVRLVYESPKKYSEL